MVKYEGIFYDVPKSQFARLSLFHRTRPLNSHCETVIFTVVIEMGIEWSSPWLKPRRCVYLTLIWTCQWTQSYLQNIHYFLISKNLSKDTASGTSCQYLMTEVEWQVSLLLDGDFEPNKNDESDDEETIAKEEQQSGSDEVSLVYLVHAYVILLYLFSVVAANECWKIATLSSV